MRTYRLTSSVANLMMIALCLFGLPQISRAWQPPLTPEQNRQDQAFREAGMHEDRNQISAMIQSLQHDKQPALLKTALLALARLGATEALPEINLLVQDKNNDIHDFAQAARARLIAESSGNDNTDTQGQAGVKVGRFFQELGKSPKQLTMEFKALTIPFVYDTAPACDIEELADMIYRGGYQNYSAYAALPQIQQVDFSLDERASLKFKIAAISPDQQIMWLINKMMFSEPSYQNLAAQLLLYLDHSKVGPAIASKLQEMDMDRVKYTPYQFGCLFKVLAAIKWQGKFAIQEHFKQDNDPNVASLVVPRIVGARPNIDNFSYGF